LAISAGQYYVSSSPKQKDIVAAFDIDENKINTRLAGACYH
jgi:myo-inositol-1-phosphate synthase